MGLIVLGVPRVMAVTVLEEEVRWVVAPALDAGFYRAVNPDLGDAGADAVSHYVTVGWREGRDPAPWFSVRRYMADNADVKWAGREPFHHYLTQGRREGRTVSPSDAAEAFLTGKTRAGHEPVWTSAPAAAADPILSAQNAASEAGLDEAALYQSHRALLQGEFDVDYYLAANADIGLADIDPLDHFLRTGWLEARDPNVRFSVKDYLETYPDIGLAGINPFIHYVRTGRAEGRIARNELGFRYEVIANLAPVEDRVAAIAKASAAAKSGSAAALTRALAVSRTGLADLYVTFSHDDYTANLGGVQLCLQREDARIGEQGRDHLHLYPLKPWPVVREAAEPGPLGLVWNGQRIGAFEARTIAKVLGKACGGPGRRRDFAIHSLLGHNARETAAILEACGLKRGYFWLHDFASLCAGFHLLRNDVEDCAAPPPDSPACGICAYLPMRRRHLEQHAELFHRLELTVVSPSQPTLDLWKARSAYPTRGEVVLPHAKLMSRGPAKLEKKPRPLRVAYAGIPAAFKGWAVFRALAEALADDPRYEFHHLGIRPDPALKVAFQPVSVTEARPRAMQEALEALEADVVMVWPLCRETFSFVAAEAVAAGCAVLTGPDSGNVAAFVAEGGHGMVAPDEDAVIALFESGEALALARSRRKPDLYDLAFSALTVDLMGKGADA